MDLHFSLLMAVYHQDSPQFLHEALRSIQVCSRPPDEVVLVCDGLLTKELYLVIGEFKYALKMNVIQLKENHGLGIALREGLTHCKYELVARFDADDICCPERFAKQIQYFIDFPLTDILGGQIREFKRDISDAYFSRQVPLSHNAIYNFAKLRNPFNHMTVMFKKSSVMASGSYKDDYLYEDYSLWVRMLNAQSHTANLPETLVYARAGIEMYERRGGLSYALAEFKQQLLFYRTGFLSWFEFVRNITMRLPVRLLPNKLRALFYSRYLRRF